MQKQLTLRMAEENIERLKTGAKLANVSVNTFTENAIEYALDNQNASDADYTRMTANPVPTLERLYHILTDTSYPDYSLHDKPALTVSEIRFLANGANREIDAKKIMLPFYESLRQQATDAIWYSEISYENLINLFPLALSYYLHEPSALAAFATRNTPDDIESHKYAFMPNVLAGENMRFVVSVEGTSRNRQSPPELRVAPMVNLEISNRHFGLTMNWKRYIGAVRLAGFLESTGYQSSTPVLNGISLINDVRSEGWKIRLPDIDIILTEEELKEFCSGLLNVHRHELQHVMWILLLLFGE